MDDDEGSSGYLNETYFERHNKSWALTYGSAVSMGFISTVGLVFNMIVILVICALHDYKKTSHWYVLNLALADSIFLFMLPLHISEILLEYWPFGLPLCVAYNVAFYVNYYSGILFLTVMSFDRYAAILHPMSSTWRKLRSARGSWTITILVWMLAISFSIPLLLRTQIITSSNNQPRCIINWVGNIESFDTGNGSTGNGSTYSDLEKYFEKELFSGAGSMNNIDDMFEEIVCMNDESLPHVWIIVNFIFAFVIPIIAMCICYGCILWRVLHPRIPTRGSVGSRDSGKSFLKRGNYAKIQTAKQRNNIRITLLVVALLASFFICWAPFHITHLAKMNGIPYLSHDGCNKLQAFTLTFAYSNSLWNPVLYTFLGANFHKRVSKVWKRIKAKNVATRDILSSLKNKKRSNSTGFRGSAASKTTKTTDSIDSVPTSNINLQISRHKVDRTFSTTELKN